jgi:hypothetical protein
MPGPTLRRTLGTASLVSFAGLAGLAGLAAPVAAQPVDPRRAADDSAAAPPAPRPHAPLAGVAATGGLILLGAAGAQAIQSPEAWPRTVGAFGQRVADQTGFYVVQTGVQRAVAAGLGWRADDAPCPRRALWPLAACAAVRTVTAVDRRGARRPAIPFLASVGAATATSLAWRPERREPVKARAFLATRLAIVLAGYAGERVLVEWRRGRGVGP